MKRIEQKGLLAVTSLAMLLALGGCNRLNDNTAGRTGAGSTTSSTDQTARKSNKDTSSTASGSTSSSDSTKSMGAGAASTEKK